MKYECIFVPGLSFVFFFKRRALFYSLGRETEAGAAGRGRAGKGAVPCLGQRPLGKRELLVTGMPKLGLSKQSPSSLSLGNNPSPFL